MEQEKINSYSSTLMMATTIYRNQNGISGKITAQIGYVLISLVAAVESSAATALTTLGLCLSPFSTKILNKSIVWLESSIFSLGWALINTIINPFIETLEPHEKNIREFLP